MLFPAVTGSGVPVLVTCRSACPAVPTAIFTVAELFPGTVSLLAVVTVAVSEMIVPAAVPAFTLIVSVKFAIAFGASVAIVQVIAPVPPTTGFVQAHPAGVGND